MRPSAAYLHEMIGRLESIQDPERREAMDQAARWVAECIAGDQVVHLFGSGHSALLAREVVGRAGGLAAMSIIEDPLLGAAERLEGYASLLLQRYLPLGTDDLLIVLSTSGRNPLPIEIALLAQERGLRVIALTSLEYSRTVTSRHRSGKRLFEIADLVLDLGAPEGDALIEVPGVPEKVGPVSTVIGAAVLHSVVLEATARLVQMGIEPPVLMSDNLDGGREHNERLRRRYRGRVVGL
ncbi:sugar isomerase domain-containing protein [Limnochorda pilosa]|uniref:SIS domain-containing protein n=1 Tax=Limnochorda pilosa TaxID=1555112 RepID=A0A0K2SIW5_LIMPI|nr:SIS domain-containing protein [Limnochorda pilosa]BAS26769.1 hypothetical protein LIP_0912 [Limnochorda pilosa]